MRLNCVEFIKNHISMRDVCEKYGLEINHFNKTLCPFHSDTHASMHIYKDSFYCFTCNTSGDIIEFIIKYFNVDFKEAIHKLNDDFKLNLFNSKMSKKAKKEIALQIRRQQELKQTYDDFLTWQENTSKTISAAIRVGNLALKKSMDTWDESEILSIKYNPYLDYLFQKINSENMADRMEILRAKSGVSEICKKILKNVQMK